MGIAILSVETEISSIPKREKFVPNAPTKFAYLEISLGIFKDLWENCADLALRRTKRTQSCFPWNRGENSPLIFTTQSSLSFLLSHRPNPCTVWFPTWFLNIISVYTFSKQVFGGAFRGRFWSTLLQYRAVWATEARAPRSFLSIIIVILTLMLTLYFPPFP